MEPIEEDDKKSGLFARHGVKLIVGGGLIVGAILVFALGVPSNETKPFKSAPKVVSVVLPPPPPPPPPPTKPREPQPEIARPEQEMVMQEPEEQPDQAPQDTSEPSQAPLGTGITGDGPDAFGLGTKAGGGGLFGTIGGNGNGSGSRWGWYASQVKTDLESALGANSRTSTLAFAGRVRIWIDANGRIERVTLSRSSLAPDAIQAVQEVLKGLQLQQSAPKDMPMPIVLQVSARRPS